MQEVNAGSTVATLSQPCKGVADQFVGRRLVSLYWLFMCACIFFLMLLLVDDALALVILIVILVVMCQLTLFEVSNRKCLRRDHKEVIISVLMAT